MTSVNVAGGVTDFSGGVIDRENDPSANANVSDGANDSDVTVTDGLMDFGGHSGGTDFSGIFADCAISFDGNNAEDMKYISGHLNNGVTDWWEFSSWCELFWYTCC